MICEPKNNSKLNSRAKAFIDFFHKQGVHFIDCNTGEEILNEKENENGKKN